MSARIMVANGPAMKCEKSTTLIPASALGASDFRGVCSGKSASIRSSIFPPILSCLCFGIRSEIEHQRAGLRSRTADHDGLVGRLLLRTQEQVAMIGDSLDHPRFAGSANPFRAGVIRHDAGIEDGIENGLARLDRDGALAARQPDLKAAVDGRGLRGLKVLDVDMTGRTA